MNKFINEENTGSPKQFARKLGVALSTLNKDIKYIRDSGINIKYSRKGRNYYYVLSADEQVDFKCGFSISKRNYRNV
ncbi:MAG: HTH domain-containing protein [Cyclobacteriaceae bacterium]